MKRMLIEISQRIKATLRSGDVVARLGGDEHVMVLKSPSSTSAALTHEVSQRLLTRIATQGKRMKNRSTTGFVMLYQ